MSRVSSRSTVVLPPEALRRATGSTFLRHVRSCGPNDSAYSFTWIRTVVESMEARFSIRLSHVRLPVASNACHGAKT